MSGILQTLFQNLRSFGGGGWLTNSFGPATTNVNFLALTSDSANKTYTVGVIDGPATTRQLTVSRFTSTGTADLNVSLTGTSYPFTNGYRGISVDTSGNIYALTGRDANSSTEITKWNSSGTIQFQQYTTSSAATQLLPVQSIIDSSSNIYVATYFYYFGGGCCCASYFAPAIIKYNSSGTVVWSSYYFYNTAGSYSEGIALDGSGNLWTVGTNIIVKANSSGTATIIKTSSNSKFFKIAIDSSSNIYIHGQENTGQNATLHSVSSTATINWSRKFVIGTTIGTTGTVTTDSSGNIYYVINVATTGSTTGAVILKYNSSGTLQWQRQLTTGTTSSTPLVSQGIQIVNNQVNITGYAIGTVGGKYYGFTISVPTDGSGTGTIVVGGISYVYAVASGTDSAGAAVTLTTQTNSTTSMGAANTATSYTALTNQLTNTTTTF